MGKLDEIKGNIYYSAGDKLKGKLSAWRAAGERIVFTNGCFDILHRGHVECLAKAADCGDRLVVGINSDSSVKRLKGEDRPLVDEAARMMVLAALGFVDAVVLFGEDTPYNLIKFVVPDVLVKGGDYTEQEVVGSDLVKQNGGKTVIIDLVPGFSTTNIAEKIKEQGK